MLADHRHSSTGAERVSTPEEPEALGEALQEAEANVVAHLAGLEDAVDDLAERLESLGREGASSTTAALAEMLGIVRGLDPAATLVASLREDAAVLRVDLAGALAELGRLVGPGFAEVSDRLTAIEQAQQERDERLAAVLSGFSEAISTALGQLGDQLGRTGGQASGTTAASAPDAPAKPAPGRRRDR